MTHRIRGLEVKYQKKHDPCGKGEAQTHQEPPLRFERRLEFHLRCRVIRFHRIGPIYLIRLTMR